MTTVLQVCRDAADELSLARPATIIGNNDDNSAQKLLRHLNATIRGLARRHDWSNLTREYTFATVASTESYSVPTTFLRFVPDTIWNRSRRFRLQGPITNDQWQAYKASVTSMAFQAFRMRGIPGSAEARAYMWLAPTPTATETIAFEYITRAVGLDEARENELSQFESDNDGFLFDDDLLTLGVIWRYKKAEGQDYSEEFRSFELAVLDLIKQDKGGVLIDTTNEVTNRTPTPARVPDTLVF